MAMKQRQPLIVYGPRSPAPLILTFGQLVEHHAEARPNSPAVISHTQSRTISYRQLQERSINLAKAMAEVGTQKGSLVGIISGTRYEYLEVEFSLQMLFSPPGFARYDYNSVVQAAKSSVPQLRDIIFLANISRKHHVCYVAGTVTRLGSRQCMAGTDTRQHVFKIITPATNLAT